MRILAAIVAAFLFASTAVAADRMPNLAALHKMREIPPADLCDTGVLTYEVLYSTPGMEDAHYWKALAVFVVGDRRPFLVAWSDDETVEAATWDKLYWDYDRDGIVDETTPQEGPVIDLICAALPKLR